MRPKYLGSFIIQKKYYKHTHFDVTVGELLAVVQNINFRTRIARDSALKLYFLSRSRHHICKWTFDRGLCVLLNSC
jgi:hypothetical protein